MGTCKLILSPHRCLKPDPVVTLPTLSRAVTREGVGSSRNFQATEEDLIWADENYENNDFAAELNALAENLIDSGKQFFLYED